VDAPAPTSASGADSQPLSPVFYDVQFGSGRSGHAAPATRVMDTRVALLNSPAPLLLPGHVSLAAFFASRYV
jgi:hypothetical protein